MKYIFNLILAVVFFGIAAYDASKCNNEFLTAIMWLFLTAWNIAMIFLMQGSDRNDKLDEVKKNQEKIIKELEHFHNIDVVFKDK